MGVWHIILTVNQVLHDDDVVSRSDRIETTATRTPVNRTVSINFWMSRARLAVWTITSVGIPSSDAMSSTSFQIAMFL